MVIEPILDIAHALFRVLNYVLIFITVLSIVYSYFSKLTWSPIYYQYGVPIFKHKVNFYTTQELADLIDQWDSRLNPTYKSITHLAPLHRIPLEHDRPHPLQFHELDDETIAFLRPGKKRRRKTSSKKSQPTLHGRLVLHRYTSEIELIGYFDWLDTTFPVAVIIFLLLFPFVAYFLLLFGLIPHIDEQRKAYQYMSQVISNDHDQDSTNKMDNNLADMPKPIREQSQSSNLTNPFDDQTDVRQKPPHPIVVYTVFILFAVLFLLTILVRLTGG